VLLAATTVGLAACGSSSSSSSTSASSGGSKNCTTKVLLVSNLTGEGSANGTSNVDGANVALSQINAKGGVLGCKLAVEKRDDESNYTTDLPVLQKALASEKYPMVINSDFGSSSTTPYLTREKILSISATGGEGLGNPKVNPYFFDVVPLNSGAVNVAAQYAIKQGHKKIAVIVDNTATGTADIKSVKPIIEQAGGSLTDSEQVSFSAVNLTPAIVRAKSSGAEALIVDLFGPAAGHLISDAKTAGFTGPIYGGQEILQTDLAKFVPVADLANVIPVGSAVAGEPTSQGGKEIIEGLKTAGITISSSLAAYAQVHDDLILFAWAANNSHSLDTTTITHYLETHGTTPVPGLSQAETTGYSSATHEWEPPNALAITHAGKYKDGMLPRIELASIPK
jgi:ABC-type branched-subunit amino acid transport system substrate-binding protein